MTDQQAPEPAPPSPGVDDFARLVARHLRSEADGISAAWLAGLSEILPVRARSIFPTESLLDHVPEILNGLADDLESPEDRDILTASAVIEKAQELGTLRFRQDATPHQVLREYDLLARALDEQVHELLRASSPPPPPEQVSFVLCRLHRGLRVLVGTSVDAFTFLHSELAERQRQRLLGFNRMASHELRQPLQMLSTAVALLGSEGVSEAGSRQAREIMKRSVARLTQMLDDIERMARAENGFRPLAAQLVDLRALAKDVVRRLRAQAASHGVRVSVRAHRERIYSDPHFLEMILLNLLANGIKYSDPAKSERWVALEIDQLDGGTDTAVLRVRDNGLGIPADMSDRVFERFVRIPRKIDGSGEPPGSGLGLSIVAECARALGGRVELRSVEGEGSTFELLVPDSGHEPPSGAGD